MHVLWSLEIVAVLSLNRVVLYPFGATKAAGLSCDIWTAALYEAGA